MIKREQKKFTYSAERENGRMKFNNLLRFTRGKKRKKSFTWFYHPSRQKPFGVMDSRSVMFYLTFDDGIPS